MEAPWRVWTPGLPCGLINGLSLPGDTGWAQTAPELQGQGGCAGTRACRQGHPHQGQPHGLPYQHTGPGKSPGDREGMERPPSSPTRDLASLPPHPPSLSPHQKTTVPSRQRLATPSLRSYLGGLKSSGQWDSGPALHGPPFQMCLSPLQPSPLQPSPAAMTDLHSLAGARQALGREAQPRPGGGLRLDQRNGAPL